MIWTSYFDNIDKIRETDPDIVFVSIAGMTPDHLLKSGSCLQFKKLAPKREWWTEWHGKFCNDLESSESKTWYQEKYFATVLSKLDAKAVSDELIAMSGEKDVCLLCYETPDRFCHRQLVSAWLNSNSIESHEFLTVRQQCGTPKRVLFLDIDGVLNKSEFDDGIYYNDFLTYNRDQLVADDVPLYSNSVNLLKRIVDSVDDIGIVWSTSWRFDSRQSIGRWKNPFMWLEKQDWIASHTIGKTPQKMSSNRFEEIHFWFSANHDGQLCNSKRQNRYDSKRDIFMEDYCYNIKNYAILDDFDSYGMRLYGDHFFRTDPSVGITQQLSDRIVKFLHEDNFNYDDLDWSRRCRADV